MAPSRNVRFESVDDDDEGYGGGLKGIITGAWARARGYSKSAKGYFKWAVKQSVLLGWIVATTTIITAMPLLLELQREQAVIELEKVQVKELLAQGYSPQDVQRMGLTLEPSVLSK